MRANAQRVRPLYHGLKVVQMPGYGTDSGFEAYVSAAGYDLPAGDAAAFRQRGSDYIDAVYGARFPGVPAGGIDQERAWPRKGASALGSEIDETTIPTRVVTASYAAALIEGRAPGSLSSVTDPNKRVKRQKVGEIEREFFGSDTTASAGTGAPVSSLIEGLLAPLLTSASAIPAVMVV